MRSTQRQSVSAGSELTMYTAVSVVIGLGTVKNDYGFVNMAYWRYRELEMCARHRERVSSLTKQTEIQLRFLMVEISGLVSDLSRWKRCWNLVSLVLENSWTF